MKTPPLIPAWLLLLTLAAIIGAVMVTAGCASYDYLWLRVRPPAPKPWFYVAVDDPDRACRAAGAHAKVGERINGCASWTPTHCTIYLPHGAPAWLVAHEERHCNGEEH